MKRFSPGAAVSLLLSAVIAVGSVSFLGPCVHEDGSFGPCHWAGQAMLGIGLLLAVLSLTALLVKDGRHSWPDERFSGINTNALILDFFEAQNEGVL